MKSLRGELEYFSWRNPLIIIIKQQGGINIDLWPVIKSFFISFDSKKVDYCQELDSFCIFPDKKSEFYFFYEPNKGISLSNMKHFPLFKYKNVYKVFEQSLIYLNGRNIELEIGVASGLKINADRNEDVYGFYMNKKTNFCPLSEEIGKKICKVGRPDCCIFLTRLGVSKQDYCCGKFHIDIARERLTQLKSRISYGSRIGDCRLLGIK